MHTLAASTLFLFTQKQCVLTGTQKPGQESVMQRGLLQALSWKKE